MPEFYIIIAQKIFSPEFYGGTCPLAPVSYAYGICFLERRRNRSRKIGYYDLDILRRSGRGVDGGGFWGPCPPIHQPQKIKRI